MAPITGYSGDVKAQRVSKNIGEAHWRSELEFLGENSERISLV